MVPKELTQIGHPLIRSKAKKITNIHSLEVQNLIKDLMKANRKFNLVGIAANQIGSPLNVFITEIRETKYRKNPDDADGLRVFINPKIIKLSQKQTVLTEGCGSLAHAGLFGPVKRPAEVTVAAYNEKGERFTLHATGLLAKVIQHEYDHLQGISIIDKFTDTKKVYDLNA